ncbi:hypothetical protein JTB14_002998 [Gonioctena quinquepunctata]|nr:hypothetical protein JTB14_002998 [Gonioctena quinquepunctata]
MAPSALLPEIMKTLHDLPISGPTGYDKTYARMKKMFIRRGMSGDIEKYIDACILCAQRKLSPHAKPAPLKRFGGIILRHGTPKQLLTDHDEDDGRDVPNPANSTFEDDSL